jgi:hypothetical protein
MALVATNPRGGLIAHIRRYWQPSFVIDVSEVVIDNRLYDGYIVQHTCLRGMSGGPVFDIQGNVRGMAVATLTRKIPERDDDPTIVRNGIVIDGEHIRRFIEAAGNNRNGAPALHRSR